MTDLTKPVVDYLSFETGVVADAVEFTERRLSDMPGHFRDQNAVRELLKNDPVLYHVYQAQQPGDATGFYTATTVIYPGRVGEEYYMTKGHFHPNRDAPEVYLTVSGKGVLVMQTDDGTSETHDMLAGSIHNIPGQWAHRTVNTGDEPLVFFTVWPIDAGHDYGSIEEKGFSRLILADDTGARIVPNPNYT